jgi:hypothetical protein
LKGPEYWFKDLKLNLCPLQAYVFLSQVFFLEINVEKDGKYL